MAESNDVLRLVAGPFHESVAAIWADDILEYFTARAARRQVWHAWLAARSSAALADIENTRRHLVGASARDLLSEAYGSAPRGLLGALQRLGSIALPVGAYTDIAAVLGEGDPGAKLLRHAKKIDARSIMILAALPKPLRIKAIADDCDLERARYLAWLFRRADAAELELPADLVSRLAQARQRRVASILEEHLAPRAFPPSPFEPSAPLIPVRSLAELRKAAQRFRNCLESCLDEILSGDEYYFVWEGAEPAVLCLRRVGNVGWRTDDVAGVRNQKVSDDTRRAIAEALRDFSTVFSEGICSPAVQPRFGAFA